MFKGYLQQMALPRGCEPEIESEHLFTSQRKKHKTLQNPSRFRLVRPMLMMFCKRCNSCKGSSLVEGKLGREMFHHSHQSVRCKTSGLSVKKHLRQKFCHPSTVLRNCQNQGMNPSKKLVIREWHSVTFYFKKYSWAPLILTHINTEHFPNSSDRLEQEDVQRSPEALRRGSTRLWVVHPMGCSTAALTSSPAPCQWRPPCLWVLPTSGSAHGRSPQRNPAAWATRERGQY